MKVKKNKKLKNDADKYVNLKSAFLYLASYFYNELSWEYFRAELMARGDKEYANIRMENARKINYALMEAEKRWPELMREARGGFK